MFKSINIGHTHKFNSRHTYDMVNPPFLAVHNDKWMFKKLCTAYCKGIKLGPGISFLIKKTSGFKNPWTVTIPDLKNFLDKNTIVRIVICYLNISFILNIRCFNQILEPLVLDVLSKFVLVHILENLIFQGPHTSLYTFFTNIGCTF